MYGGSNHLRPPRAGESALRYFTKCTDETYHGNVHVKSIVQPQYTEGSKGNPHSFKYVADRYAVASNFDKVRGSNQVLVLAPGLLSVQCPKNSGRSHNLSRWICIHVWMK